MADYYLKFDSEADYIAAAQAAGIDLQRSTQEDGTAIDVVGVIDTPVVMDGMTVVSGGEALPGWHVNLRGSLPDGWDLYCVNPATPRRVWA